MAESTYHVREEGRGRALEDYVPLFVLVAVTAVAATAIAAGFGELTLRSAMRAYMGVFLTLFALLKLFDLQGFADGFEMYDLGAKRSRAWALTYPFVELSLGLWWLGGSMLVGASLVTIAVFSFGAVGVVRALREGLDIECPCMGNVLSVPLSTVTLVEDLGMVAMAALMLAI